MPDKHLFTSAEKWAVWSAHDGHCFWCEEPFEYKHCTIDHLIPEKVLGVPGAFEKIVGLYKLDTDFLINSFPNWVPAHHHCNARKAATLFDPSPAFLFALTRARRKARRARDAYDKVIRNHKVDKILGYLEANLEARTVSREQVLELVHKTLGPEVGLLELAASASQEADIILLIDGWHIPINGGSSEQTVGCG